MKHTYPVLFGLPDKSRRFDLPLHTRLGTEFLVMLLALMTSLCLLTAIGSISLSQMAQGWQSNLENTLTIEIPYGKDKDATATAVMDVVEDHPAVKSATRMTDEDVSTMLKPWLGAIDNVTDSLPIPTLITIQLNKADPEKLDDLKKSIFNISDKISMDGHEEWLGDLRHLSHGVQFIGLILMLFISVVTYFTVSGAVRSRMAIHQTELELLHIMGAHDKYIRSQFQKYILLLTGKGILIGTIATLIFLGLIYIASTQFPATLPKFTFYPAQLIALPAVVAALVLISLQAARHTVSHVLKEIP
jgi:cell division transport system permease protein